jgi:outer membrane protein assembly factor BamB
MSSFASPLAYRGHVYIVNRSGVVTCLEAENGTECYAERLSGSIWATPVGIGGCVFLCCKDGGAVSLACGREFRILAEHHAEQAGAADPAVTTYGIAVSGPQLLVRSDRQLCCLRLCALDR